MNVLFWNQQKEENISVLFGPGWSKLQEKKFASSPVGSSKSEMMPQNLQKNIAANTLCWNKSSNVEWRGTKCHVRRSVYEAMSDHNKQRKLLSSNVTRQAKFNSKSGRNICDGDYCMCN